MITPPNSGYIPLLQTVPVSMYEDLQKRITADVISRNPSQPLPTGSATSAPSDALHRDDVTKSAFSPVQGSTPQRVRNDTVLKASQALHPPPALIPSGALDIKQPGVSRRLHDGGPTHVSPDVAPPDMLRRSRDVAAPHRIQHDVKPSRMSRLEHDVIAENTVLDLSTPRRPDTKGTKSGHKKQYAKTPYAQSSPSNTESKARSRVERDSDNAARVRATTTSAMASRDTSAVSAPARRDVPTSTATSLEAMWSQQLHAMTSAYANHMLPHPDSFPPLMPPAFGGYGLPQTGYPVIPPPPPPHM